MMYGFRADSSTDDIIFYCYLCAGMVRASSVCLQTSVEILPEGGHRPGRHLCYILPNIFRHSAGGQSRSAIGPFHYRSANDRFLSLLPISLLKQNIIRVKPLVLRCGFCGGIVLYLKKKKWGGR